MIKTKLLKRKPASSPLPPPPTPTPTLPTPPLRTLNYWTNTQSTIKPTQSHHIHHRSAPYSCLVVARWTLLLHRPFSSHWFLHLDILHCHWYCHPVRNQNNNVILTRLFGGKKYKVGQKKKIQKMMLIKKKICKRLIEDRKSGKKKTELEPAIIWQFTVVAKPNLDAIIYKIIRHLRDRWNKYYSAVISNAVPR